MFINITQSETGDNKGSCHALVQYLEKENKQKAQSADYERWFNGTDQKIHPHQVRIGIDNNISKLGAKDSKFFLINLSPSYKELTHLLSTYGQKGAEEKLKEFVVKIMDEYAKNFKRPGIDSEKDLLWFGKLEHHRYYAHTDKDVKSGLKKTGEQKEGPQMHIQIIVSRKDITGKVKLSPQNTSKGRNSTHSKKMGQFDRTAFKQFGEIVFDRMFEFQRNLRDHMLYANLKKNGNAEQKALLYTLESRSQVSGDNLGNLERSSSTHIDQNQAEHLPLLSGIAQGTADLIDVLIASLAPLGGSQISVDDEFHKKKRRKKSNYQNRR